MNTDLAATTELRATCSRDDLAAALGIVARGLSTRGAVQVLSGILLRGDEGNLTLASTDMEISLRATVAGDIAGDGAVVVPGRLLTDLARLLPDDSVTLSHDEGDGVLQVTSGSHSSRLNVYSAEDFPRLPPTDVALHTVAAPALLATIDKVARAASRDESRPVLTGILVRFEEGKLVMAATDSYRLSVKETELAGGDAPQLEAIVPARSLAELGRIGQDADELQVGVQENHVVFGAEGVWLTTRRIDGQFPNHRQLIPEEFEHEVTLPREEFLDVVRRTSVMAQRNSPLRLRFAEGELTVSAQTQDIGEARESLPVAFSGDALEIGFNPEFLRDGIESVAADEVQLKLISPLRPGLLRADEEDFSYLIMPIRLAG
jgi:DNA polymerase III subunit beta